MELTEKEIQTVGEGRYIRRHWKKWLSAVAAVFVTVVIMSIKAVDAGWLVVMPIAAIVLLYCWFYLKVTTAGKEFAKKYLAESDN